MAIEETSSEVAILSRVLQPKAGSLPAAAARAWLQLNFTEQDRNNMQMLLEKARAGILTSEEELSLDNYRRVGRLLDLMHSKARLSLRKGRSAG